MAIWAEIKKAINSNLDKPLNVLIDENIDDILKAVAEKTYTITSGSIPHSSVWSATGRGIVRCYSNNGISNLVIDDVSISEPLVFTTESKIYEMPFYESISFKCGVNFNGSYALYLEN